MQRDPGDRMSFRAETGVVAVMSACPQDLTPVNGIGVALLPNILGGPGAVNAGLIATQAITALDFPLAMAVSAIMMGTLMSLLYIGHRLFDLTKVLAPMN